MAATPVKIGPFVGGLNTYSEPTSIGDNEFADVINFDIDLDGSLYSRAPFLKKDATPTLPGTGSPLLLGWFVWTDGTMYLIMSCTSGTYARNETTGVWTTITTTFAATVMLQYANKAWLVAAPAEVDPGGTWDPVANFVADADIPKGTTAVIYKERLFIGGGVTNPNRVYFSDAANFGVFQTTVSFFDVRAGDGQNLVKMVVFQDTIVIFKDDSTYAYSYDSSPSRGAVRVINSSIGVTNRWCVVEHENNLYVHNVDKVYQFANWTFTQINMKVPFVFSDKWATIITDATLSVISNRLLVHHADSIYVFNLRNATWTIWDIATIDYNFNYFIAVPQRIGVIRERYYAGSRNATNDANRVMLEWTEEYPASASEALTCRVTTKTYDFNVPYTFKRLFWWGADLLDKSNLTYVVHPVTYAVGVTHDQMSIKTHTELHEGTHLQPLSISIDVTDSMVIGNTAGNRMFIKLLKSMRFRQINFTVSGTMDGSLSQGPLRIYSLIAFIDNKQLVSKQVS